MKRYTLLVSASLLFGIAIGFWIGNPAQHNLMDKHYNMVHENNTLLEKVHNRLNQLETESIKRLAVGNCQTYAGLLSSIRETISKSILDSSPGPITAASTTVYPTGPTEEQHKLYDTMEQRIYTYATSGQPLMEAMSSDPKFDQLTTEQKKQLALEVVDRFNRGEITMDQIQGR
ncbi:MULTISPECIES: hypothetical protein [unclassified Microbulbifer]|uniref:hypothetical protein n=1 Tax=unclassified Microbulbifer TaxID=2619833 RepID=UPI0027E47220|nr:MULTISPECIES: hypothetical protein [unclassified Microbulbifer]